MLSQNGVVVVAVAFVVIVFVHLNLLHMSVFQILLRIGGAVAAEGAFRVGGGRYGI